MNVYFDTSCLGRPFDDQLILRNAAEREAMLTMLEMTGRGELSMTISDVVQVEIAYTPNELRRQQLTDIAALANTVVPVTREIVERGTELQRRGFKPFDALHLAAAESTGVDRLCTTDDRFKKRSARQQDLNVRVVFNYRAVSGTEAMIKRSESLVELNREAWRVLVKELGVVKATRFLCQFDTGSGNYATDRDAWQEGLTVEKIVANIERRKHANVKKKGSAHPRRKKPTKSRQA